MNRSRENGAGGFILLESVAVLMLSALVLAALVITAGLVSRNAAASARRTNEIEALATGLSAFRRDASATRLARATGGKEAPLLFGGASRTLDIVTQGPNAGDGEIFVHFEAKYDNGIGSLVRSWAPRTLQESGLQDLTFRDPVAILSGPWQLAFAYAGAENGSALTWAGSWADAAKIPRAIRLTLSDSEADRPALPPLVVPIRVDTEPRCALPSDTPCGEKPPEQAGADGQNTNAQNQGTNGASGQL